MRAAIVGISGVLGSETAKLGGGDFTVTAGFDERNPILNAKNADFDVIIEFATPEATVDTLAFAKKHGVPVVIGTTGHDEKGRAAIRAAAEKIPVMYASNFSLGAYALGKAAVRVKSLLPSAEVTVVETHRKGKKDAPGGTAKDIAAVLNCEDVFSIRRGDVVGIHEIIFDLGGGQTLTLRHDAGSRRAFSEGAIFAARKLMSLPAGLYGADDIFGESDET